MKSLLWLSLVVFVQPVLAANTLLGVWETSAGSWPTYATMRAYIQPNHSTYEVDFIVGGESCPMTISVPTSFDGRYFNILKSARTRGRTRSGTTCNSQVQRSQYGYAVRGDTMIMMDAQGTRTEYRRVR